MNPFLPPTGSQGYQQQQTTTTTSTTSSYPPYQFTQQQQQPPQNVQPYPNIYGSTTSPSLVSMNAPGVNSYGSTSNGFNNNNNNNNSNGYQSNVTAPGGISSSMGANGQPYNPFGATGVSTPSIPAGPYSFPSSSFPSSPYQPPQQQHQQPTKQLDPFANLTGLPSSSSTTTTSSSSSAWASPPTAPVGNPFDFQQSTFTSTTAPAATAGRPLNSYSSATQNQPMQTMGWSPYTPPMQQQQQQQFQQQDQYDLIAKVQNISMQQKQMRPAPSPAVPPAIGAPQTQQTNQFFQSSDPFGFQPAPSSSSATQQNPYQMSNSNAFSTTATTTTTGYPSSNSANTNIFGSDDDAGFFSFATTTSNQTTQKAAVPPPQRAAPKAQDAYEPPTEEDQRLLRRASLLFEQGIIKSKEDKVLLQDKLLQKNKAVKEALQKAEHGDHGSACIHLLKKLKSGTAGDSDDDDDDDAAGDSDDDNKSEGTLSDDESPKKEGGSKGTSTIEEKAPHPRAGGWTGSIPATLFLEKEQFCGNILMRISSKMLFRKWKPVFVAIDVNKIAVYPSRRDWEVSGPTKAFFMIHSAMWVAKPSLKKTQSVADDGRRVFYTTVKENIGYEGRGGPPQKFSPALEHRVVVKFGSYYPNEIGSIAYAIYSCVTHHLKGGNAAKSTSGARSSTGGATSGAPLASTSRSSYSGGRYS